MNNANSPAQSFDVFLCHNSEDKPEIRAIADDLENRGIKVWLDEREIRPGTIWQSVLEEQISTIKSVAVFVGQSGIGPWQSIEIRAFITEFVERECPVIPAILPSANTKPQLPVLLKNLHYVDFRDSNTDPTELLIWGITGQKPMQQASENSGDGDGPGLLQEKERQLIEIRLPGDFETFSSRDKEMFLAGLSSFLKIHGGIKITESRPGSIRLFLELTPEEADKIYTAARDSQLENLGITEARLYPSLADPPDQEQRSRLAILLNRVKEFWIDGVLKQSLHNEVLISLGKKPIDEVVDPPWNRTIELPRQRSLDSFSDTRIETVFDATGLLLILGEPGSGKTTTLLELLSILAVRAETDIKERIPIVLNLSSWVQQQPLAEWIAIKLNEIYSVPVKLARAWLDQGYLIPLLDGLDEVRTERQADCVEAINAYITQTNPAGLVVCSRLAEYQWLPERLKMNGAICLQPLTRKQIDAYLGAAGPGLEVLREAVKDDAVLQELSQSPLMLGIMGMTYQSSGVGDVVVAGTAEAARKQIFGAYVEQMFQRRLPPERAFTKDQTNYWLSWLARRMVDNSQSVFFPEALRSSWLRKTKQKLVYRGISALIFGGIIALILWLIFGVAQGLAFTLIFGMADGLLYGLLWGSIFALFAVIVGGIIGLIMVGLNFGLILGLICGLGIGTISLAGKLLGESPIDSAKRLRKAILQKDWLELFIGIIFGLTYGNLLILPGYGELYPNINIRLSLKNGVFAGLFSGLFGGLFVGLIVGLMDGPIDGLMAGLIGGSTASLIIGLNWGLARVIQHYTLRLILWRSGYTPFNYIKFLDYCTQIILLKKVGGGYIFIHRMLLEYFAALKQPTS
ncbi:MAG: TIR domain-containing protein [Methylococcaceae bacterium]|nr:TIR domain-containing protein [Methylococcaceae bacterium]